MTRNPAMRQRRSPLRAVIALVTVGAVFIGAPIGLVRVAAQRFGSSSPLDGLNAPWRWTLHDAKIWGRYLTNGFASTHQLIDLLYRAALITLWVCLAVLAYTIITETVFQLRHGMPSSPRSNPLGQLGRIVATMLVAVLPISSAASLASATPLPVQRTPITHTSSPGRRIPPPPSSDTHQARASTAAVAAATLAPAWRIHVVQPSESVLSIAQHYADGRDSASVAQQIVDANIGRAVADGQTFKTAALIEPGWRLRVPATSTTPTASSPAVDTAAVERSTPVSAAEAVTVSPGDSYWREAEHHLPPDTSPAQVADFTQQLIRENAPRLGYDNPKMLHPGDTLYITPTTPATPPAPPGPTPDPAADPAAVNTPAPDAPAPAVPPPAGTATAVAPEAADNAPATGRARDQIDTTTVDATANGRARDQIDTPTTTPAPQDPTVATTGSVPGTFPAPAGSPSTVPASSPVAASIDDGQDVGSRSPWLEVTYGSLLAAGIVAAATRLRRRRGAQLAPGTRPVDPPDAAIGAESVLATGGPLRRISTLTQLMRTLTPYAREEADPPLVRAVQFDRDTVEVLFTRQAVVAPAGWEPVSGGHSWLHRMEDNGAEETTSASAKAEGAVAHLVTPSLVTIGHVGERQVLLDLDTAGSIALTGDRTSAEGVARSMLFELASQPLGHWADVIPCGVSVDGLEHLDGVWAPMSVERAVRHVRSCITARAEYGAPSIVAARSDTTTDTGMWNSVVVVIDATSTDPDRLEELLSLCEPGSGYVTVVIGNHHAARERLHLVDDRTAVWQSTTLTTITQHPAVAQVMTPPVVTHEAASHLAVLLDHAAASDIIDTFTNPTTTDPAALHVARADGSFQYVEPEHDVVLRTFGVVELTSVNPEVQADLTPKQTELVALIATHRDTPINADVVVSLLSDYGQKTRDDKPMPVESLSRRISEARTRLGDDRDGNPFLPYSPTGRGAAGRYQLSPRLKTDYELLTDRYHAAQSLPSADALTVLRDGLALLTGPPLRARNLYQWAAPSGATTRILAIVHGYLGALLEHANTRHDATTAHVVLSVLALVTDDPMLELPLAKRVEQFETVTPDDTLRAALRDWRTRLLADIQATDPLSEAI